MTRRESRKNAFLLIFQLPANELTLEEMRENLQENEEIRTDTFCLELLSLTLEHLQDIDDAIRPNLKRWTIERLPRVSLAVLRVSCAQLMYMPDLPESVIINEAVELAKEYGTEDEFSFVNGTLRSVTDAIRPRE